MRVLLMTPPEALTENGGRVKHGKIASPPLGLGYIAAVLEGANYNVSIIDFAAEQITDISSIIKRIQDYNPDIIGISFITITANQAFDITRILKKRLNIPIILGGPHPTYFPEDTLERVAEADVAVIGEGEAIVLKLIEALFANKPLDNIENICYRNEYGKVIRNKACQVFYELDKIPAPARHLFKLDLYAPYPFQIKRRPTATMITSRGCSYGKCTFCYSSAKKTITLYRRHSVRRVMEEIKFLIHHYGIREVNFLDDDFAMNEKWVSEFCDMIHKEKIDLSWICMVRASSVSKGILFKMAKAGCWNIFFGIESANQYLLDRINKGITVQQNRNAVIWAHEAGMQVSAAFMMLLPGETPEDARRNVQFAKELDIEFVAFGPTRLLAGTPLFEQCQVSSKGNPATEYYKRSGDYFIPYVSFIPEGYTEREALSVCRDAYRKYYLRPRYVWKMLRKIKSYEDIKRYIECVRLYLRLV